MTPAEISADFDEVVRRLEEVHPGFPALVGPTWPDRAAEVRGSLAGVSDPARFWWVVAPLVAAGGDGHTTLWPPTGDVAADWTIEVRDDEAWVLDWGWRVGPALPPEGARVVSVEGVSGASLVGAIRDRFGGETEGFRRWRVQQEWWRALPVAVEALGGTVTDTWHLVLERGGRSTEVVVTPAGPGPRRAGWLNAWFAEDVHTSAWPAPTRAGALIDGVVPGGGAAGAGLRGGDLVVAIDGEPVGSSVDVGDYLTLHVSRGDVVELDVVRGGVPLTVAVEAGRWRWWDPPWSFDWVGDTLVVDVSRFEDPSGFARRLDAVLALHTPRRVVVDLRGNDGGDAQMPELLCRVLCRTEPLGFEMRWRHSRDAHRDQRHAWGLLGPFADVFAPKGSFLGTPVGGTWRWRPPPAPLAPAGVERVDVVVDGGTFSAGVYAAHLLRTSAQAEVWGEPPGSGPRFHAHGLDAELPTSHLELQVSSATFRVLGEQGPLVPDHPVPTREALRAALGR